MMDLALVLTAFAAGVLCGYGWHAAVWARRTRRAIRRFRAGRPRVVGVGTAVTHPPPDVTWRARVQARIYDQLDEAEERVGE